MILTTNQLLERVYHYYARGVGTMDPEYPNTKEKLRLVEQCKSAGSGESYERFRQMLRRLGSRFPELNIQNGSLHLAAGGCDACYSAKVWLPSSAPEVSHYYLGFFISLIAPVYLVYRTIRYAPPESKSWTMAEHARHLGQYPFEYSFSFTPEEQPYAHAIASEIEATFGSEPLSPEIGNISVPDVDADQRGLGKETLFTCLFSGYW